MQGTYWVGHGHCQIGGGTGGGMPPGAFAGEAMDSRLGVRVSGGGGGGGEANVGRGSGTWMQAERSSLFLARATPCAKPCGLLARGA